MKTVRRVSRAGVAIGRRTTIHMEAGGGGLRFFKG
jgi:hypothetical protein